MKYDYDQGLKLNRPNAATETETQCDDTHEIRLRPGATKLQGPNPFSLPPKPPADTTPREENSHGSAGTAEKQRIGAEEEGRCADLAAKGDALNVDRHDGATGVPHLGRRLPSTPQRRDGWSGLLCSGPAPPLPPYKLPRAPLSPPVFFACVAVAYKRRKEARGRTSQARGLPPSPLIVAFRGGGLPFHCSIFAPPFLHFPIIASQPSSAHPTRCTFDCSLHSPC